MMLYDAVSALMRGVAAQAVMPHYRLLSARDISEKSPGELVTIADREAEARLHAGLLALSREYGISARIIGEEAVAGDAGLLDDVGTGLVWLVDPLDGTANFAAGREPFGMMIALVEDGEPLEGWILAPLSGRMCHAARGRGARFNGHAVRAAGTGQQKPRAALGTHFLPPAKRGQVHDRASAVLDVRPVPRCAAESYARLVLGQDDVALFQRILPWDHAAGALFLKEAGGVITHWDGSPYRIGGPGKGVLAAATQNMWDIAAANLLSGDMGLVGMEALSL